MDADAPPTTSYATVLTEYLTTSSEASLYHASLLGQRLVELSLGPDDIIALHADALEVVVNGLPYRQRAGAAVDALQFLLDVMIAYGVHHQQYLELRLNERTRLLEAATTYHRQRALDAERSDTEKSEILTTIAHELRTPLTAARGLLDLATRSLDRGAPAERIRDQLRSARRALDRLTRLSADLVEASRGEPPTLELVPLDLAELIAQACRWMHPAAEEKRVSLTCQCQEDAMFVNGDTDALHSIFSNLLSNAIRYTPAGGRIDVACEQDQESVTVTVTDSGIGMTAGTRERVFEKFYRAPEAKSNDASGLGVGLALTLGLVQAHRGEIAVESIPGAGSAFRVTLPRITTLEENERG